jgi:excisionase family DNA binding protein
VEDEHRKQLTVAEAAEYLGLTRGQIEDLVERGVLEADKVSVWDGNETKEHEER